MNIKTAPRMVRQSNLQCFSIHIQTILKCMQLRKMATVGVNLSVTALRSDVLSANTSHLKEKILKGCSLIRPLFNIDYVCKISWRGGGAFFSLKPSSSHTQKPKYDLAVRCVCLCVCACVRASFVIISIMPCPLLSSLFHLYFFFQNEQNHLYQRHHR